jgi:radical SAM superfamily enzyme YgiQ (UPF0313 family)
MRYHLPLFRPPSEAESLILQVTVGCSHNRCSFCSMYRMKRFRPLPREEVREAIGEARRAMGPEVRRVFLADGDALCLSTRRLVEVLDPIAEAFPELQRVSAYANARDVLSKSLGELEALRARKLGLLYMGLESGDEQTLTLAEKGATVEEIVEAVRRAQRAGMTVSTMVLIGLAGRERSLIHARTSAEAVNTMEPAFTALLTYTPVPGSPLFEQIGRGEHELPTPIESLLEIREFLSHLHCRTTFSCNHASNYLPLRWRLPSARERLLGLLAAAIDGEIPLKPEFLRGL